MQHAVDTSLRAILVAEPNAPCSTLKLPANSSFDKIPISAGSECSLSDPGASVFSSHKVYQLPADLNHDMRLKPVEDRAGLDSQPLPLADEIHHFQLREHLEGPLNAHLTKWVMQMEEFAMLTSHMDDPPPPGPDSYANVNKTNRGGYRSYHNMCTAVPTSPTPPPCRCCKCFTLS